MNLEIKINSDAMFIHLSVNSVCLTLCLSFNSVCLTLCLSVLLTVDILYNFCLDN